MQWQSTWINISTAKGDSVTCLIVAGIRATREPTFRKPYVPEESPGEPLDVSSSRLSARERQCQLDAGLCLYCGEATPQFNNCPRRRVHTYTPTFCLKAELSYTNNYVSVSPFIDSGLAGIFVTLSVVCSLQVLMSKLPVPAPLQLSFSGHTEELQFFCTPQVVPSRRARAPLVALS